jgi:pSer/pThr/pTyr-binding forkhead associated (FHA) protein
LFSASGDQMAALAIPPQRSATVALRFEDAGHDALEAPHAVTFTRRGNQLFVSDEQPESTLYLKLARGEPWLLDVSDTIRIGQQSLLFVAAPSDVALAGEGALSTEPFLGLLEVLAEPGAEGLTVVVPESGVVCGRATGDLVFPEDPFISGTHCTIERGADGLVYLADLGSTNGTFVRLSAEHPIRPGDVLRVGPIFFRVDF